MYIKRIFKYYYLKFIRLKGDPKSLATGAAIGVFIGITPTLPFHTVAIIAVTLLTRTSTIAGILAATVVSNPLTFALQYYLSMVIGNTITPYELTWQKVKSTLDIFQSDIGMSESIKAITNLGMEAIIVLLAGGIVLAIPFTIVSYFCSFKLFVKIREKRRAKHLLN